MEISLHAFPRERKEQCGIGVTLIRWWFSQGSKDARRPRGSEVAKRGGGNVDRRLWLQCIHAFIHSYIHFNRIMVMYSYVVLHKFDAGKKSTLPDGGAEFSD